MRYLKRRRLANAAVNWACYHTEMWRFAWDGTEFGIIGCAVGAPFAVLLAEQLFASGCRFLISVTSAGQIAPAQEPPYFILIDRALRDEATSYHYLPPSRFAEAAPDGAARLRHVLRDVAYRWRHQGPTWTTDAPYRETQEAVEAHHRDEILAVEMEAAALYAFSPRPRIPGSLLRPCHEHDGTDRGRFREGRGRWRSRRARFDFNRCERLATLKVGPTSDIYFSLLMPLRHSCPSHPRPQGA